MDNTMNIDEISSLNMLDISKAKFTLTDTGFLSLEYGGEKHEKINLKKLFPFSMPYEYISVVKSDEEELGIIRNILDAATEQAELLKEQLMFRYFCPNIERITNVREKMGYLYIDIISKGQKKRICIGDFSSNIRLINNNDVIFIDIEGNRYIIENYNDFDLKSRQKMELFL